MAIIREETSTDIARIHELTIAAFLNAPHSDHREHLIVDALRQARALTLSLVAEDAGTLLGHVAVSPISITDGSTDWFGLGPIAVEPSRQNLGIGSQLMDAALLALRNQHANGCVVLGEPHFYTRFGFKAVPGLSLPGAPAEYFLAVTFNNSYPQGEAAYHQAFTASD